MLRRLQILRSWSGTILLATLLAFIVSQTLTTAHAVNYDDKPHKHDGQICVLSIATASDGKIIASAGFALLVAFAIWRAAPVASPVPLEQRRVAAAQPRGPPTL